MVIEGNKWQVYRIGIQGLSPIYVFETAAKKSLEARPVRPQRDYLLYRASVYFTAVPVLTIGQSMYRICCKDFITDVDLMPMVKVFFTL